MKYFVAIGVLLFALTSTGLVGASAPPMAQPAPPPEQANANSLKMALVNMKCLYSDGVNPESNQANIQANLRRHCYFVDKLAAVGVEFIGFPELSINGYHFSNTMTWLNLDGPEVQVLRQKAKEKGVWISVGMAIQDADGKRWNVQIIIDPTGRIVAVHRKIYLAAEQGWTSAGDKHDVFDVKGLKVGIAICADGTNKQNLDALVKNGAQLIYAPHASNGNGTIAAFYAFRKPWGGPNGWIAQLKIYAALHNQAGLYNPEFNPPAFGTVHTGWGSGAWLIGPDGQTLAQMPSSAKKEDSKEFVLTFSIPIPRRAAAGPFRPRQTDRTCAIHRKTACSWIDRSGTRPHWVCLRQW